MQDYQLLGVHGGLHQYEASPAHDPFSSLVECGQW
jgi:hypothetical protein